MQSGTPFSVTNSASVSQTADGDVRSRLDNCLNRAALAPAPGSRYGNPGRNTVRGPGANLRDMRLSKVSTLHQKLRLRFVAEAFNAWNHAAFGRIRTTLSSARIVQLQLRLEF
jgi:hypothetical protein